MIKQYGDNERMAKAKYVPVLQFSKTGDFIKKWDSATEASRVLGINQGSICMCCRGKRYKSVGGYKWCYADDYEKIPFKVFDLELYRKRVA